MNVSTLQQIRKAINIENKKCLTVSDKIDSAKATKMVATLVKEGFNIRYEPMTHRIIVRVQMIYN